MMSDAPLWKELVNQDDLETMYRIFCARYPEEESQNAYRLARYAEALVYERARKREERLEADLAMVRDTVGLQNAIIDAMKEIRNE